MKVVYTLVITGFLTIRIASAQSVGIGSSSFASGSMLSVDGNMSIGNGYRTTANGVTNGLIVQGNVGIGTTSPVARLELTDNTQLAPRIKLSGQEFYQAANTSTEGLTFILGVNRTNNRQLWLVESDKITQNATNIALRLLPNTSVFNAGIIDVLSTDATTLKNLGLNPFGGNVGVGTYAPLSTLHTAGTLTVGGAATAGTVGNVQITTSGASPIANRLTFGTDGSGWKFAIAKNQGGTVTEFMTIQDNGNIGIGTTSPSYNLHLQNSQAGATWAVVDNQNVSASAYAGLIAKSNAGIAGFQITSTANGSYCELGSSAPGPMYYDIINATGDHIFRTTATSLERMRITTAGNVGIGSATPGALLDIGGSPNNAIRTPYLNISANNVSVTDRPYIRGTTTHMVINGGGTTAGGDLYLNYTGDGTTGSVRIRENLFVMSTGNVGIGSSSPQALFQVHSASSSASAYITAPTNTATASLTIGENIATGEALTLQYNPSAGGAWPVKSMTLQSNPGATGGFYLDAVANAPMGFYTNNLVRMYITAAGNVGIGNAGPTEKLSITGNVCATGTITASQAGCGSDIRWKKNIQPIADALSSIRQLNGVYYDWRVDEFPDKEFSRKRQLGFIAQEMQKVYPELVITDNKGFLAVDYQRFTAVLLEAAKEQQKTIEHQEAEIDTLKKAMEGQRKIIETHSAQTMLLKADMENLKAAMETILKQNGSAGK